MKWVDRVAGLQRGAARAPSFAWESNTGEPVGEAHMMPHRQATHGAIGNPFVSIRHIEALTGLDFLSKFDAEEEERISTHRSE